MMQKMKVSIYQLSPSLKSGSLYFSVYVIQMYVTVFNILVVVFIFFRYYMFKY